MSYFLTSSDVIVFVVTGEDVDVVDLLNQVVGFVDPTCAKIGTLRELGQNVRKNIAHSSSNIVEALKSLNHFFTDEGEITSNIIKCSL